MRKLIAFAMAVWIGFLSIEPAVAAATITLFLAGGSLSTVTANNPGSNIAVPGSASVTWRVNGGGLATNWSLTVYGTQAAACPTVPVSAIMVQCASATRGGNGTATCSAASFTALTTGLPGVPLATGKEGNGANENFTVALNYQFSDAWSYIANASCALTLHYTLTAP